MSAARRGIGAAASAPETQDQTSALRARTTPANSLPAFTRKYRFNFLSGKAGSGPFSFSDRRKDGDE